MKAVLKKVTILLLIALLGSQSAVSAEPVNKSVKEYFENQDKINEEEKSTDTTEKTSSTNRQAKEDGPSEVGVTFFDFIKMIFALLFVVALLYTVLRFVNKKSRTYQSSQLVENLGGTSLGSNRSVQLVKVGNQILVVGVGEDIQLLKEIHDEKEYREMIEAYNQKMELTIQPSDIITKMMDKLKSQKKQSEPSEAGKFASLLQSQLKDLSKGRQKILEEMEKEGKDQQ